MTDKLSAKQLKAVSMLAEGLSCSAVAKSLSITPQTISAWKRVALFQATINSIAMSNLEKTRTQLQYASSSAVDALIELAGESSSPETFAWGVESTAAQQVEKDIKIAENPGLAGILGDLFF